MTPARLAAAALAATLTVGAEATADAQDRTEVILQAEPAPERAWSPSWPTFRWWEYAGSAVLLGEAFAVRFGLEWEDEANWRGGIMADDWTLETFRITNDDSYDAWVRAGDVGYYGSLAWPAIDPLISGIVTDDWQAASQMALMNVEAFAVFASVLWTTQYFVRRERPDAELCTTDPQAADRRGVSCEGADQNRSFIGGHTGVATTNAALTCLHHTQMDLYGDAGDATVCGAWIAAAGVTFVSRTITGKHYLSDDVLGVGLGLAAGWLVPWALHYAHDEMSADEDADDPPPPVEGPQIVGASVSPSASGATFQLVGVL